MFGEVCLPDSALDAPVSTMGGGSWWEIKCLSERFGDAETMSGWRCDVHHQMRKLWLRCQWIDVQEYMFNGVKEPTGWNQWVNSLNYWTNDVVDTVVEDPSMTTVHNSEDSPLVYKLFIINLWRYVAVAGHVRRSTQRCPADGSWANRRPRLVVGHIVVQYLARDYNIHIRVELVGFCKTQSHVNLVMWKSFTFLQAQIPTVPAFEG